MVDTKLLPKEQNNYIPASEELFNMYKADINLNNPPELTKEEEIEIFKKIRSGDEKAREQMIMSNLRYVISVAKDYTFNSSLSFIDVIQEGNCGLIKAIEKFDPSKDYKFLTYAHNWIRHYIQRAYQNQNKTIRIPVHAEEKIKKIASFKAHYINEYDEYPTLEEISAAVDIDVKTIQSLEDMMYQIGSINSLDQPVSEDEELTLMNIIPSTELSIEEKVENSFVKHEIFDIMKKILDNREIEILCRKFGFGGLQPETLAKIGADYGISKEAVRVIINKAKAKLKKNQEMQNLFNSL